jgi:DNA repair protein RecN (Recombination protein N)
MLCELHLRNLAVAEDVSLRLDPRFNVLTGSTGAGKSLVTEAVRWLRGEPIDRGVLRAGVEFASAEATFDLHARPELIAQLRNRGVEVADDGLLRLRREQRAAGRSRAWVDGRLASAALLQQIGEVLIQSQAQHLQLGLLDPRRHVAILDSLGVDDSLVVAWTTARAEFNSVRASIADWASQRDRLREQHEIIEFQWRELHAAGLLGDELESLRRQVSLMEGGARLLELAQTARDRLEDDSIGVSAGLAAAVGQLRRTPDEIEELRDALGSVEGAVELVREASSSLEHFLASAELDPAAFDAAQERLTGLLELTRKYARTEPELIRLRDRLREQLDRLATDDELPSDLVETEARARERLDAAGRALHGARKRVARRSTAEAAPLLAELGMIGAELEFEMATEADPDGPVRIEGRNVAALPAGPASVTLLARTNPGERLSPVNKGASGGELSRIALVLRSLALRGQAPALLLLDEVDAGIGADLAAAVARRLGALAESGQLLVISHQAHIAAAADRHLVAVKATDDERASSEIRVLDRAGRIEEIVRMIGADTPESQRLASELLAADGTA